MTSVIEATTFTDLIFQALEHFDDPLWLGQNSPLSQPYVLATILPLGDVPEHARSRGTALQAVVLRALVELSGEISGADEDRDALNSRLREGSREQRLIYWRYIHLPRLAINVLIDRLGVAKATFHRDMKDRLPTILSDLATILSRLLRPALRLDAPPEPERLYGREVALVVATAQLHARHQLGVIGVTGVGKSAFAAHLAVNWPGAVFWVTLRPGLNDSLQGIVPLLGAFFHMHGATLLSQQLLADGAAIRPSVALSLLRADCNTLERPPLLCFDAIDLLVPSTNPHHIALCSFLEALLETSNLAVLTIGSTLLQSEQPLITLSALPPLAVHEWLNAAELAPSPADWKRIEQQLMGNAQLIRVLVVLARSGMPLSEILEALNSQPALAAFWGRLLRQLSIEERAVLVALCAFRLPVPQTAWLFRGDAIQRMIERGLVQVHAHATVAVWSLVRDGLWPQLTPDEQRGAHQAAAIVRAQLGQYTAAADHLVQIGAYQEALMLWFPQRESEIRDGQAVRALAVLELIPSNDLAPREAQILSIARSELRKLTGEYAAAIADLEATTQTGVEPVLQAHIAMLQGSLWEAQSLTQMAQHAYERALAALQEAAVHRETGVYARRGAIYLNRERDLDAAQREALMAHFTSTLFQGEVADEQGNYQTAAEYYQDALNVAQRLNDPLRQARTHFNLGILAARQVDVRAIDHFEAALRFYDQIGDVVRVARTRTNLAAIKISLGQYADAIPLARQSYEFFNRIESRYWSALSAVHLSEAAWGLGDWDASERYAEEVIHSEEMVLITYALYVLGNVRLGQQRYSEAEAFLQQSITLADESADRFAAAPAWRILGQVHAATGALEAARSAYRQALDIYTALQLPHDLEVTRQLLEQLITAP